MRFLGAALILIALAVTTTFAYQKTQQADIDYYEGLKYSKKNNYDQAIPFFVRSLSKNSRHKKALRELGFSYASIGDFKKSIDIFSALILLEPEDYDAKKALAEICVLDSQYGKARDILIAVLDARPQDSRAALLLAQAYIYLGQPEMAEELLKKYAAGLQVEIRMAEAYLMKRDYENARAVCLRILEKDPSNLRARLIIADSYAYSGDYKKAIAIYKDALSIKSYYGAKVRLADTLSWSARYDEALKIYDELLKERDDKRLRIQKARILGWAARYNESSREYKNLIASGHNGLTELELKAKEAYWNKRFKKAIEYYKSLLRKGPSNIDAEFDLSQIYSYQSMWKDAIAQYKKILLLSPSEPAASKGFKKAQLASQHTSIESGYEFFEADSASRDSDIKRHTIFNRLAVPLDEKTAIKARYDIGYRKFSDFSDTTEQTAGAGFEYRNMPDWQVDGFYNLIDYNQGIKGISEFGSGFNFRMFDVGVSRISYYRKRLENESLVIRNGYYSDNYSAKFNFDINSRVEAGVNYIYSAYYQSNHQNQAAASALYRFSLEPKMFYVMFKYLYQDFAKTVKEYFSPKDFSTSVLEFGWRHVLAKDGIFFGAKKIYYDLRYEASVDSSDIAGNKFSAGFTWDVSQALGLNISCQYMHTSASVYEDKGITASAKYYF